MIIICGEGIVDLVNVNNALFRAYPGGSPLNVSVGLARLGQPVFLLARLGQDAFGQLLRAHVTSNSVAIEMIVDAAEPTSLAVVSLDATGTATYDFYLNGTADWQWDIDEFPNPLPSDSSALHTGSLTSWLLPGARVIEKLLTRERERGSVVLSFDPNVRPLLAEDRATIVDLIERHVRSVHIVKASNEDLAWLYPDEPQLTAAQRWVSWGPELVVVTKGKQGCVAFTASGMQISRDAVEVSVVDTVGAGDAFMAGLLDGLARGGMLEDAGSKLATLRETLLAELLDCANAAAALTCTRPGADPPTRSELLRAR